jgi:hypothetical protein
MENTRFVGYIDDATGNMVKREEWAHDDAGWYLLGYDEIDYNSICDSPV